MRVHHIINSYSSRAGGAERLVRTLHQGLLDRGVDSRIYGLIQHGDEEEMPEALCGSTGSPYSSKALGELYRYVRHYIHDTDIVHAHLFPSGMYLALFKKFRQLRSFLVYTEHSTSNRRRNLFYGKLLDRTCYSEYKRIYAISSGVKEELIAWLPFMEKNVRIVTNGAINYFKGDIVRQPAEKKVILSVGRLSAAKNYMVALRAFALLSIDTVEYWIAGSGKELDMLKQLCTELGITEKVRFLGHVDHVAALLETADIFLIPSLWEGFGLAAVEAMNASLPVVASDIPGLREVVAHKPPCAMLIDPQNPESIVDALHRLLGSRELRFEMGKNGYQHSLKYSSDAMVDGYLAEYKALTSK